MMLSNREILQTALRQSAVDLGCRPEDFLAAEPRVVVSRENKDARRYLELPFDCNLVSYGSNIVASVRPELREAVHAYLAHRPAYRCFETPRLHALEEALKPYRLRICFMAEYFLPDAANLHAPPCDYEIRLLGPADFKTLYQPEWSNALCEKRKELDVLGAGAYDHGRLIGLAGCSADCAAMWQIGIDVLPAYRRQGIAAALTGRLALEILGRGKVPFYCAAWSNLPSVRCAIGCGFRPAWVELTAKSVDFTAQLE